MSDAGKGTPELLDQTWARHTASPAQSVTVAPEIYMAERHPCSQQICCLAFRELSFDCAEHVQNSTVCVLFAGFCCLFVWFFPIFFQK